MAILVSFLLYQAEAVTTQRCSLDGNKNAIYGKWDSATYAQTLTFHAGSEGREWEGVFYAIPTLQECIDLCESEIECAVFVFDSTASIKNGGYPCALWTRDEATAKSRYDPSTWVTDSGVTSGICTGIL